MDPSALPSAELSINRSDLQGFAEVTTNVANSELDLVIHSGGGDPDAAEAIVNYLRSRFNHIRVFVPFSAMSAATMVALAADEIVLASHAHLGPIDTQLTFSTANGIHTASAQSILDDFESARQDINEGRGGNVWTPILEQMHPGLISYCKASQERSRQMVAQWMKSSMFRSHPDSENRATQAADAFANFRRFGSHGRPVSIDMARDIGIPVTALEDENLPGNPAVHELLLSVFHATALTFEGTGTRKLIENHLGVAWTRD